MGVTGLWRLIEPTGKPVPLETLENKVLAVDISIWLHQAIKGFRDARGGSIPNAHLLGIYHRVCKLLYFKIKPIFVFDGGVPGLKQETIRKRNQFKAKNVNDADRIQKQLLDTLLKHSAVSKVISEKIKNEIEATSPSKSHKTEDIYKLPELDSTISSDEEEWETSPSKHWNLHSIDEKSEYFKSLPPDVRHEILTELKETRKQSSWGIIHQMPKESGQFSNYQMKRLLKRYSVQTSLEEAEKEMGGHSLSLAELESLLNAQGVVTNSSIGNRIASDENTRYLYIKDIKKTLEEARQQELVKNVQEKETEKNKADLEYENDLQAAIQLSLQDVPSTSKNVSFPNKSQEIQTSSSESSDEEEIGRLKNAKSYMMEYSGLTPHEIANILGNNSKKKSRIRTGAVGGARAVDSNRKSIEETLNVLSDSDSSSDFCEVTSTEDKEPLQVTFKTNEAIEDDLFSDVFADGNQNIVKQKSAQEIKNLPVQTVEAMEVIQKSHAEFLIPMETNEVVETTEAEAEKEITNNHIEELPHSSNIVDSNVEEENETSAVVPLPEKITNEQLTELEQEMNEQAVQLRAEKLSKERLATDLTDQVYQETQELLELFGVPYIIAPMEAEAQCAFLNNIGVTDGTITDDSDIWLFGGKTVYKNFFDQQKHVLQFQAEDIQHCFKLSREQMILLALLVGSDYTTGLQGVGPVTALEILSVFPPSKETLNTRFPQSELLSGLVKFKQWLVDGRSTTTSISLRNKLKNVVISDAFPSLPVIKAYLDPTVDKSSEPFSWGKPHMNLLIDFAKEKFGWTQIKSESILKPVIKRLDDRHIQKSIKDYFKSKHNLAFKDKEIKMSKRVKKAVENLEDDKDEVTSTSKVKKRTSRRKPKEDETKVAENEKMTKIKKNLSRQLVVPKPQKSTKRKLQVQVVDDNKSLKKVLNEPNLDSLEELAQDEDIQVLQRACASTEKKVEEIEKITVQKQKQQSKITENLHKKQTIPQKERDKAVALRSKLKAIEVFRKSKLGTVKKQKKEVRVPKEDAELSESSSNSD